MLDADSQGKAPDASLTLPGTIRAGMVLPMSGTCCILLMLDVPGQAAPARVRLTRGTPPRYETAAAQTEPLTPAGAIRHRVARPLEAGPAGGATPAPTPALRRRAVRPLAVATAQYERIFVVSDGQYFVSFQSDILTVVALPAAPAAPARSLERPAASLGLQDVRATVLWCPGARDAPCNASDTPAALLVAGAGHAAAWQVVVVPLPITAGTAALQFAGLHDAAAPLLPECQGGACHTAGGLAAVGSTLYVALERDAMDTGLVMATMILGPVTDPTALQVTPLPLAPSPFWWVMDSPGPQAAVERQRPAGNCQVPAPYLPITELGLPVEVVHPILGFQGEERILAAAAASRKPQATSSSRRLKSLVGDTVAQKQRPSSSK